MRCCSSLSMTGAGALLLGVVLMERSGVESSHTYFSGSRTRPFKPYRRKSFQSLIERIHFNAHGFEGCYSQQRLGVRVAEDNRAADEFAHEFDLPDPDVELEFGPIGQLVCPLALRLKADGFEMRSWDEAIRRANQQQLTEQPLSCGHPMS
ncbi:MAG: hypothetical protein OXI35_16855, partial [Gemmatimonadota bacterium]|nr:hypothetical protein [Gemmatimonadota bacterium]